MRGNENEQGKRPVPKVTAMSGEIGVVIGWHRHREEFRHSRPRHGRELGPDAHSLVNALRTKPTSVAVDLSGVRRLHGQLRLATLIEAARIAHNQGTR